MNSTEPNNLDETFGFWPLLIPLAASIATPLITKAVSKKKKGESTDATQPAPQPVAQPAFTPQLISSVSGGMGGGGATADTISSLMPLAQQMIPNMLPSQPTQSPVFAPPQPALRPEPINAPAVPFEPTPAPATARASEPFVSKVIPAPAANVFQNLGVPSALPPVTMMTTNYAVRGTDNKMRTLKVPSRPLESGESIKVRITFYAATNKAGLAGCGLDTNSTNFLGAFGNKLVPFKSVAASIGNFAGKNSRYTVSPENHPVFKKFQKLKIPEVAALITEKLGIPHDGIFTIDDTGQDVVAQVSENGANPVIDVFVPDCMDIRNLGSSIRYATVTVV